MCVCGCVGKKKRSHEPLAPQEEHPPEVGRLVHIAQTASRGVLVAVPDSGLQVKGRDGASIPALHIQDNNLVCFERDCSH